VEIILHHCVILRLSIQPLQHVMNGEDHMIMDLSVPVLQQLHWLPVRQSHPQALCTYTHW